MRFPRFPLFAILLLALASFSLAAPGGFAITSPDFAEGAAIPSRCTCEGQNVPPTLVITGVPAGAQSLALLVEDPDAPSGTFTHWLVWNIPPATTRLGAGSLPAGVRQGTNSFGVGGYSGPCPPSGTHRYYFRLSALDIDPRLPAGGSRQEFDAAISGHVLASAELMGRYAKSGAR